MGGKYLLYVFVCSRSLIAMSLGAGLQSLSDLRLDMQVYM